MPQTCPRCGAAVADGQRDKHGAFHTELDRLAASVAEHHHTPVCHEVRVEGRAEVDLRERSRTRG